MLSIKEEEEEDTIAEFSLEKTATNRSRKNKTPRRVLNWWYPEHGKKFEH